MPNGAFCRSLLAALLRALPAAHAARTALAHWLIRAACTALLSRSAPRCAPLFALYSAACIIARASAAGAAAKRAMRRAAAAGGRM